MVVAAVVACVLVAAGIVASVILIRRSRRAGTRGETAGEGVSGPPAAGTAMRTADLAGIPLPEASKSDYVGLYGSDGRIYAIRADAPDKLGTLNVLVEFAAAVREKILPAYAGPGKERLVRLFADEERSHVHHYREEADYAAYCYTAGDNSYLHVDTSEPGGAPGVGGDRKFMNWQYWYGLHELAHLALGWTSPSNPESGLGYLKHDRQFFEVYRDFLRIARDVGLYDGIEQPRQPPDRWTTGPDWEDWSSNWNGLRDSDDAWLAANLPKIHSEWFGEDTRLYPVGDPRRKA